MDDDEMMTCHMCSSVSSDIMVCRSSSNQVEKHEEEERLVCWIFLDPIEPPALNSFSLLDFELVF